MGTEKEIDLLSPCSDYIFKNIFGKESHKRALISLINSILDGKPLIKDVVIENSEIPKDLPKGRSVRLDVRATASDSTKINIEIQCCDDGRIINRSAFYQSKMMLEGLKESEEFDSLPNMISIWLANYDETKRKYHTHEAVYTFKETPLDSAEVATDKFRTFIVELPKVDIRQENISKVFKAWVYFLRNPEEIPPEFLSIPEVEEAMTELKRVSQNPKVRRIYNERMWLQDLERNAKAHSYNLGVKEGRMEGRIEGELSKARNMARKLLLRGMDLNDVIDITGLDKKDIINLMN